MAFIEEGFGMAQPKAASESFGPGSLNEFCVFLLPGTGFLGLHGGPGLLFVVLNVIAVNELAGDGVVGMGEPLLLVKGELVFSVHTFHYALGAAEAADSNAVLLEIEVVAVTVGTYALGALVVLIDDAVSGNQCAIGHLLCGLIQVQANLMGLGNGLVVHNDVQGPGEALVVNECPLGGQCLGGKVTLDPGGPVAAADAVLLRQPISL